MPCKTLVNKLFVGIVNLIDQDDANRLPENLAPVAGGRVAAKQNLFQFRAAGDVTAHFQVIAADFLAPALDVFRVHDFKPEVAS